MTTTFILHGGETRVENENNKKFYQSWVASFDDLYVPTILLVYFARKPEDDQKGYIQDTKRFKQYANNRKVNFIIADRDLEIFKQQVQDVDVIYFRGGSSNRAIEIMKPLKGDLLNILKDKIFVGVSAGVMFLSQYTRSNTSKYWKQGLGLFPWVSFVHWSEEFRDVLEDFKKEHVNENLEYILLPETEFITKIL